MKGDVVWQCSKCGHFNDISLECCEGCMANHNKKTADYCHITLFGCCDKDCTWCKRPCKQCDKDCICSKIDYKQYKQECFWTGCDKIIETEGAAFCPRHEKIGHIRRNRTVLRIEMYEVGTSSLVKAVGYEPVAKVLRLKLVNNLTHYYDYEEVPVVLYSGIVNAQSMGAYYNRFIKGKFEHTVVPINEVEPFFADSYAIPNTVIDYTELVKHLNLTDLATAMCKKFFGLK